MFWIGDTIILLASIVSVLYGTKTILSKKTAFYFQLIVAAIACNALGYIYDLCEVLTMGDVSEGFNIGYLGNIGCFLFLLSANYGCMDGIVDDRSRELRKYRFIAAIAAIVVVCIYIPNIFAHVPFGTKMIYLPIWIIAMCTAYLNFKHAIIPDMGFGFIKAIRPFNIAALLFTAAELIHLTLWNLENPILLVISGIVLAIATFCMVLTAERGVRKWAI